MPRHRLARIPYGDLRARIARARRMDVARLSGEQVFQRIGRLMDGYTTFQLPILLNGVFRARKNPASSPFDNTRDLWYPPASAITRRGRFNEEGESVFYACNKANGAFFELHPAVGDTMTLVIARTRESFVELPCAHIGLERCLAPELRRTREAALPRSSRNFNGFLRAHGISNRWLRVDDFLSEMATGEFPPDLEEDKYKITNAISKILFGAPEVEALNYPSVATHLKCVNLCMKPEVADRYFVPAECWMVRIEEERDSLPGLEPSEGQTFYRTTFLRKSLSIGEDGSIEWSNVLTDVRPEDIRHLVWQPRLD